MDDHFKKLLEEYQKTSDKIEKILQKSEENKAVVATVELKLDLMKDEWQKMYKVIYGDGLVDSLPSRLRMLESQVEELTESIEEIEEDHKKTIETERHKMQKITLALIGGLFTIASTILAWFFDFKNH